MGADFGVGDGRIRTYRDLIAWQKGRALCRVVYPFTQRLPGSERFGLISQMQRAVISVPSNIAEGYGLGTRPLFLKHLRYSRGSLAEPSTYVTLCGDLYELEWESAAQELLDETDRVVQGLIRSLERAESPGPEASAD